MVYAAEHKLSVVIAADAQPVWASEMGNVAMVVAAEKATCSDMQATPCNVPTTSTRCFRATAVHSSTCIDAMSVSC
jgi:hypothetical protein